MASHTKSAFSNILKINYKSEFYKDAIMRDNSRIAWVLQNIQDATGSQFQHPVYVRRASGSTSQVSEGGAHPTAATGTVVIAYDTLKYIETSKTVTQQLLDLTRAGKNTYESAASQMAWEAKNDQQDQIERNLFAINGFAAICASCNSAGTTITLASDSNMDQFYVGQSVEVLLLSSGLHNSVGHSSATTISSISKTTPSITVADAVQAYASVNSSYGVAINGNYESGTGMFPHSLNDLCGTTTGIHGLNTTTYPEYVGIVKDVSGAATISDLQYIVDQSEMRTGGTIGLAFAHDSLLRKYQFEIVDPRTIQQPGSGEMGTGDLFLRTRSKRKIPLEATCYANPTDRIWFVDKGAIKTYATVMFDWESDDTGEILHKVTGYSYYEAVLNSQYQLCAFARYRNGYLDNIT